MTHLYDSLNSEWNVHANNSSLFMHDIDHHHQRRVNKGKLYIWKMIVCDKQIIALDGNRRFKLNGKHENAFG